MYNGLVRLQDEDCFIDVFSRLEDKHRMNSSNLISVYYISDEINAPMEVDFHETINFVISVIPNSGSFIRTLVYIGIKDDSENIIPNMK